MVRKILAASAAFALIAAFSLATLSPADAAAKKKRAKVVRVAPAPATAASCVADILFLPVTLAVKKRVC